MNAPEFLSTAGQLPPLSHHAPAGSAPRVAMPESIRAAWTDGLAGIASDAAEPICHPCDPTPIPDCQWLAVSSSAAQLIGQNAAGLVQSPEWLGVLSGGRVANHMQPYACVYAGHQFGVFVPRLGDGRALNLGAIHGWELQLKGAGPTPYARFADGRAVLRSSIREFLCSEAMHGLGIPTTRALSLIMSSAPVLRESVETAAIVCRLAPSFVRFGTFEYFASRGRVDVLETLVRHANGLMTGIREGGLPRPYGPRNDELMRGPRDDESVAVTARAPQEPVAVPTAASRPRDDEALELINQVAERTASLMAQWMGVGFMHGVMNTDNFSILGLTIDYGPFGFMDAFDAHHICNHSDHSGRYRYSAQPQVGLWNVARLMSALQPLVGDAEQFTPAIETYKRVYAEQMDSILRAKLGLKGLDQERWSTLLDDFYTLMQEHRMDYTATFRALCSADDQAFFNQILDRDAARPWLARYRQAAHDSDHALGISQQDRLSAMRRANPKYVLRNWVAEEVIRAVRDDGNTEPFNQVFRVLQSPFEEHPDCERYASPPPDWAQHLAVSCSS